MFQSAQNGHYTENMNIEDMFCLGEKKLFGITFVRINEILTFHWDLENMRKNCNVPVCGMAHIDIYRYIHSFIRFRSPFFFILYSLHTQIIDFGYCVFIFVLFCPCQ